MTLRGGLKVRSGAFKGDVGVISQAMHDEADGTFGEGLRAPFPWFGGKRRVANLVWDRLGNVDTYNEPFAGSLAVLLGRPHQPRVETVNDLDCYLANFWRALQHDPDGVAAHCDWPVNEADLHARHRWLVESARDRAERVMRDPEFYDVQIAGWWVWGQCLWIGSGWCQTVATARRTEQSLKRPKLRERGTDGVAFDRNASGTVHQRRRPQLTGDQGCVGEASPPYEWTGRANAGRRARGINADRNLAQKRPRATGNGQGCGVHRWQGGGQGGGSGVHAPRLAQQKPVLGGDYGCAGRGVHADRLAPHECAQRPDLSAGGGRGLILRSDGLYDYMRQLAARLRRVRVCAGDWKRVLTPSVTTYIGTCGVFLDPPYSHDLRERCYAEDHDISADVRAWALEHGDDPNMRIALCGYQDEHGPHMPSSWECVPWKAHGGYSRTERGVKNREQERIWFSKFCLKPGLPFGDGEPQRSACQDEPLDHVE